MTQADQMAMTAKTFQGLEELLADELAALGAEDIEIRPRAVLCRGDQTVLYKANLHCRTALSLLLPKYSFHAKNPEDLYRKALDLDWDAHFSWKDTFAITHTVNSRDFPHSQFAALKLKDAIVDVFRKKTGRRPNVEKDNPTVRINLHIHQKQVTISFDSSGEPLYKRGYRTQQTDAPINEVLAAGMLMLANWRGDRAFLDPMCGSGTLPIEAAMIAMDLAPGHFRSQFGFMNWPDYDPELWESIRLEAWEKHHRNISHPIIGADIEAKSIDKSRRNAAILRCNQLKFAVRDFFEFTRSDEQEMLIMLNPPYGERLRDKTDIPALYRQVGDQFKQKFGGCEAWVISSHLEGLKRLGLHASKKYTLFNGPLECRFMRFELYEGSRKTKTQPSEDAQEDL